MNDIFRNFISPTSSDNSCPLVGTVVELKGDQIRIESLIAEGGYGYVFRVRSLKSSKLFALKRLIASSNESLEDIENEISMLGRVQPHKHIMDFHCWDKVKPNIHYLLCEFCGSGSLKDIPLPMSNKQQLHRVAYQLCLALERIHSLGITHRDVKIENVLFDNSGFLKLCDFGSCTDKSYSPDISWTPTQRSILEDEVQRHTTPMYRAPEVLDTYLHYEINSAMDIWAYGCLLFCIRFGQHPFEDSAKLRIINCNYTIPSYASDSDVIVQLIKQCLVVDPSVRTNATSIIKVLEDNFVDLNSPCVVASKLPPSGAAATTGSTTSTSIPSASAAFSNSNVPGIAQSYLSGFTRYLKDTSSKVMQTVQNSIARQDLDLSFLTSRLVVMSYPAEGLESAYRNHIDDVKAFLDSRGYKYLVINVSGRTYDQMRFGPSSKVIDGGDCWKDSKRAPSILSIISLCDTMFKWVNQNSRNTLVIHCTDGKTNSAMLSTSLLIMIGLFRKAKEALNCFEQKRTPVVLTSSQARYLKYVSKLKRQLYMDFFSSKHYVTFKWVKMHGIPLFTKLRDGCRPYIEIHSQNNRLYTTCTDYERLIQYNRSISNTVTWNDINAAAGLTADIQLVIYHARSSIGSKMLNQTKITPIRITSAQLNLFFEVEQQAGIRTLVLTLKDLDDTEEIDRFPSDFRIEIQFEVMECDSAILLSKTSTDINQNEVLLITKPDCLFSSATEFEEFKEDFNLPDNNSNKPKPTRPPPPSPKSSRDQGKTQTSKPESSAPKVGNIINFDSFGQENASPPVEKPSDKSDLLLNLNSSGRNDLTEDLFSSPDVDLLSNDLGAKLTTDDLLSFKQPATTPSPISVEPKIFPSANAFNLLSAKDGQTKPTNNLQRNTSTPNLAKFDPFGDLLNFSDSDSNQTSTSSAMPRVLSFNAFPNEAKTAKCQPENKNQNKEQKSNYSRENFANINTTGVSGPRVNGNEFEDLLGTGFKKAHADTSPKSIAQLRKEEILKSDILTPTQLKILEWTENKQKNIRALLCSMNSVLWPGCNWNTIGMHQLLTSKDVKKMYHKACLAVHPDKLVGSPHEELAKHIIMELNEAMAEFEKSS